MCNIRDRIRIKSQQMINPVIVRRAITVCEFFLYGVPSGQKRDSLIQLGNLIKIAVHDQHLHFEVFHINIPAIAQRHLRINLYFSAHTVRMGTHRKHVYQNRINRLAISACAESVILIVVIIGMRVKKHFHPKIPPVVRDLPSFQKVEAAVTGKGGWKPDLLTQKLLPCGIGKHGHKTDRIPFRHQIIALLGKFGTNFYGIFSVKIIMQPNKCHNTIIRVSPYIMLFPF